MMFKVHIIFAFRCVGIESGILIVKFLSQPPPFLLGVTIAVNLCYRQVINYRRGAVESYVIFSDGKLVYLVAPTQSPLHPLIKFLLACNKKAKMIVPNTVTKIGLEQLNKQVYYLKRLAFNCTMPVINCLFVAKANTNHCSR